MPDYKQRREASPLNTEAKLSVQREGKAVLLKIVSKGKKPYEHNEMLVRLSEDDRAWLRRELK